MAIWSKDDIARIIINVGREMGITPRGIVIGLSVGLVESNLTVYANAKVPGSLALPHDAVGSDGMSVGVQQQQVVMGNGWWWGPVEVCQDPTSSTRLFFQRLAKRDYNNGDAGAHAQAVQGSAFPDRYGQRMAEAQRYYDRLKDSTGGTSVPDNRPDFNEWPMWSPNNSNRNGTKIDLFILHTQEGGGGDSAAEDLAKYLQGNNVSYHYTVGQASDGGVTVVDVVDTDYASWSVLSANSRSINLCFAGSRASWSRADWMKQSKAIDAAAYLAVQDCKKYGIPLVVIGTGGNYSTARAGVTDHQYVTKVLKDGTHTDVGGGFPVDYFTERFNFWANGGQTTTPTDPEPPATTKRFPDDWTDRELLVEILRQLRGPALDGWEQLNGKSLVDAVSAQATERQAQMGNAEALATVKAQAAKGDKWARTVIDYMGGAE